MNLGILRLLYCLGGRVKILINKDFSKEVGNSGVTTKRIVCISPICVCRKLGGWELGLE